MSPWVIQSIWWYIGPDIGGALFKVRWPWVVCSLVSGTSRPGLVVQWDPFYPVLLVQGHLLVK